MSGSGDGDSSAGQREPVGDRQRVHIPDRFTLIRVSEHEARLHSLSFSLAVGDQLGLVTRLLTLVEEAPRSPAELARALPQFSSGAVGEAVNQLLRSGALEPERHAAHTGVDAARHAPQINFFSHFTPPGDAPPTARASEAPSSGADFQALLASARVLVFGAGRLGSRVVRDLALSGVGRITVVDDEPVTASDLQRGAWQDPDHLGRPRSDAVAAIAGATGVGAAIVPAAEPPSQTDLDALVEAATFAVVVRDHVRPAEYKSVNRAALSSRTPWTSGRPAGFEFHLGPTVLPYETACHTCADLRVQSNLPDLAEHRVVSEFLDRGGRLREESLMCPPGAELVTLEVIKAITLFSAPSAWSALLVLDLLSMDLRAHPVLKIPRCPDCGRPSSARPTVHAWQQRPRVETRAW